MSPKATTSTLVTMTVWLNLHRSPALGTLLVTLGRGYRCAAPSGQPGEIRYFLGAKTAIAAAKR
jgi:hypothetical protein